MRHHALAAATGFATAVLVASGGQSLGASADPTGYWMKPDAERESKIQVFKCGKSKTQLCAKIAWLKDPKDSRGRPLHDVRNQNTSLRDRPIVGLTIFSGLTPSAPSTWTGKIYNPEDGQIYSATLTVLSRKQILLKGCKAWLLCGERQWLRTSSPPEELKPDAPAEGTEQIEASLTPSAPAKSQAPAAAEAATVEAEVPDLPTRSPTQPDEMQASAAPEASAGMQASAAPEASTEPQPAALAATPAVFVPDEIATHSAPPTEYNWRQGYGFVSVPGDPASPARFSGEDVSSMMVMSEPIASQAGAPTLNQPGEATSAVRSGEPVPTPQSKPKVKAKPVVAAAAAKPAPKPAAAPKTSTQAPPTPQETDTAQVNAESADAAQATTAEASMAEETPLTRRQRRLLRRQQQQQEPFLPWLR
jgi:uncharacterized protein (DUF2147 family)